MNNAPRIMLAAPASGAGKTTVTLALLSALQEAGCSLAACKCGPDYIDTMFHQEVLGIPGRNLDSFLCAEYTLCALLQQHAANRDITVIEGVMGYYDGVGGTVQAGSYDVARITATPVVLVLPATGAALSLAAMARGFADFRSPSHIAGLILNNCSEALYTRVKTPLEEAAGLPLFGYLPRLEDCTLQSRHLGLVTAAEIGDFRTKLAKLGQVAQNSLDITGLRQLASTAPALSGELPLVQPLCAAKPRIAVAYDKAFCFYYADNFDVLRQLGAELAFFSPLSDSCLPKHTCALYLGGGYPELYAEQLSANKALRDSLRKAIAGGLPTLAECGGFLYLQQTLDNLPMVGALPGAAQTTPRLQRFGYITITAREDNMLCQAGDSFAAHEFHYCVSSGDGEDFLAVKPDGRSWPCVYARESLYAGFPHLYFYGNTKPAARFVAKAAAYGGFTS